MDSIYVETDKFCSFQGVLLIYRKATKKSPICTDIKMCEIVIYEIMI